MSLATELESDCLVLAIETSGPQGAIALLRGDALLGANEFNLHQKHAQVLIPGIQQLLLQSSVTAAELKLIAVSAGPGSFTGLRVGVMTAKTLAYATGAALVAVGTLAAIVRTAHGNVPAQHGTWAVENAQRGDLFALWVPAGIVPGGDHGPPVVMAREAFLAGLGSGDIVTGPGLKQLADSAFDQACAVQVDRPAIAVIGGMGLELARHGRFADPWTLEPVYLRRSAAEDQWQKLHGGKR